MRFYSCVHILGQVGLNASSIAFTIQNLNFQRCFVTLRTFFQISHFCFHFFLLYKKQKFRRELQNEEISAYHLTKTGINWENLYLLLTIQTLYEENANPHRIFHVLALSNRKRWKKNQKQRLISARMSFWIFWTFLLSSPPLIWNHSLLKPVASECIYTNE